MCMLMMNIIVGSDLRGVYRSWPEVLQGFFAGVLHRKGACILFKLMSNEDVYARFGVYRTGIFYLWACRVGDVTKAVSDCVAIVFKQTRA